MGAAEFPSLICFSPQRKKSRRWAGWIYCSGQVVCIPKGEFGYGHPDCGGLVHLELYFTLPIASIAVE